MDVLDVWIVKSNIDWSAISCEIKPGIPIAFSPFKKTKIT